MANFATPSTRTCANSHKLQTGPLVEMANPGLWFYEPTLWRYSSCANWGKTFSLSLPPFSWQPGMSYWTVESALCWLLFSGQEEFMHFTIHREEKKQCRLLAGLWRRQTVQSTAPGSQCYAQNWVSLSRLSCSREHTHGEVKECFSQAVHLSGNADSHFDTFEEVNTFIYNAKCIMQIKYFMSNCKALQKTKNKKKTCYILEAASLDYCML